MDFFDGDLTASAIPGQINLTPPDTTMPQDWRELLCTAGRFDESGDYIVDISESERLNWFDKYVDVIYPIEPLSFPSTLSTGGTIGNFKGIKIFVETEKEDLIEESNAELDRFLNQFSRKGDNV